MSHLHRKFAGEPQGVIRPSLPSRYWLHAARFLNKSAPRPRVLRGPRCAAAVAAPRAPSSSRHPLQQKASHTCTSPEARAAQRQPASPLRRKGTDATTVQQLRRRKLPTTRGVSQRSSAIGSLGAATTEQQCRAAYAASFRAAPLLPRPGRHQRHQLLHTRTSNALRRRPRHHCTTCLPSVG